MTSILTARPGAQIPRHSVERGYGQVMELKVELISSAHGIHSIRDFGGFYSSCLGAARAHRLESASLRRAAFCASSARPRLDDASHPTLSRGGTDGEL